MGKLSNFYSDELIEEIRSANDIVDIVSEYVTLEKKGANYFGLCPFHAEKSPSFSVSATKQIYYCFGCGKGGNVINFIMKVEALDFKESLKLLADKARIALPENLRPEDEEKEKQKLVMEEINREAARFFHKSLGEQAYTAAAEYLEKRKISNKIVKSFGIGYNPDGFDVLYKHLKSSGFSDENLLKSGLILKGKTDKLFDRFRGRLIFPIFDVRGKIIGFGGRVLDSSMPKYMNSPETMLYSKGRHLFALNFAKHYCKERIIIVEGYMDVVSLHQVGINNVVAVLGTALTENQGRLLKKYTNEIITCFDADSAGQNATLKSLDILDSLGCKVKVLTIPDGKDPDEYIKNHGKDAFENLIVTAKTLPEYKLMRAKENYDVNSADGKLSFLQKATEVISKIDNGLEQEIYLKKLALEYDISEETLTKEVLNRTRKNNTTEIKKVQAKIFERSTAKSIGKINLSEKNEKLIICLLCVDNRAYRVIKDVFSSADFSTPELCNIASNLFDRLENGKSFHSADLFNLSSEALSAEFAKIIQNECVYDDISKAILEIIKRIELDKLEQKKKQIILEIEEIENKKTEGDVELLYRELNLIISDIQTKKK